jgi:hypothetical protein
MIALAPRTDHLAPDFFMRAAMIFSNSSRIGRTCTSVPTCVNAHPSFASRFLALPSACLPLHPAISFLVTDTPVPPQAILENDMFRASWPCAGIVRSLDRGLPEHRGDDLVPAAILLFFGERFNIVVILRNDVKNLGFAFSALMILGNSHQDLITLLPARFYTSG